MRLRKTQLDASEATGGQAGADKRRRRPGRGWGPFSGGQLTVIVVTFAVLLLAPVGAWAVTGSSVFITDAHSGSRAKVTSAGQLSVAAGSVVVSSGSVVATPAIAGNLFQNVTTFTADMCTAVATAPATLATVVTKVQVGSVNNNSSPDVYFLSTASDCSTQFMSQHVSYLTVGTSPTASVSFDLASGVALKSGDSLFMGVENGTANLSLTATALGYDVPASQCTTGCI